MSETTSIADDGILDRIEKIKKDFVKLKNERDSIKNILTNINKSIDTLKDIYKTFINENHKQMFIFSLDSFKFQNKLIDIEYNQMVDYYNLLHNRIYCDYYRLLDIMLVYIHENIDDEKTLSKSKVKKNYPKYDYLNIYKCYDFKYINEIFDEIIQILHLLKEQKDKQDNQLVNYKSKRKNGFNINNFLHTIGYKNNILHEQVLLYINYIDFFMSLHTNYINKFKAKIYLQYKQLKKEINFEGEEAEAQLKESIQYQENALFDKRRFSQLDNINTKDILNEIDNDNKILSNKHIQKMNTDELFDENISIADTEISIDIDESGINTNELEKEINIFNDENELKNKLLNDTVGEKEENNESQEDSDNNE